MNTVKSQWMIFNYRGPMINQLMGMKVVKVVEQLKYLGITVSNKMNCILPSMKISN